MMVTFTFGGQTVRVDLHAPIDISVPVSPSGVTAWGVDCARIAPHQDGDFTGAVAAGASVNFNDVSFNPHAHGTHTESAGHILEAVDPITKALPPPWMMARLITVEVPGGEGIPPQAIQDSVAKGSAPALIIRTAPRPRDPKSHHWTGTNPPFLSPEAAGMLAAHGVLHLLIDLPSVDPEADGGALKAHKAFWGLPAEPRKEATITELVDVPEDVPDGLYVLNLQVAAFQNDASPSRPLLFRIQQT